jgi:malonate transporter and related proteins
VVQILTQDPIPLFVCLLFGYVAGRRNVASNTSTRELVTFLMSFALPCALFITNRTNFRRDSADSWSVAVVLSILTLLVFLNGAK